MINLLKKLFKWSEPKYYYHVSYFYKDGKGTGHGRTMITTTFKMDTESAISKVSEHLLKENGFDIIIMLNWIQLKGE